ncbi:MAG: D-alanyl-D-alanine carboxypeptidase [Chloroflexi bacterium]|nr:MAG: D-alanyl-D-alanine carboxypeptidase [Chloroflexota bacterium]
MTRRRYTYSYSPSPRRERRVRQKTSARRGWLLLLAVFALVGAVLGRQMLTGDDGSAAARSNCWTQIACSAERVEPKSEDSPSGGADAQRQKEPPPAVSAAAVAVLEEPCGALVHSVNAHAHLPPASLTKIVTALVADERVDLSQTVRVTVDSAALSAATDATVMGLEPGQTLGMVDLLYGLLLPSGNDAALQIAQQVAGNMKAFADLMNARVAEAGLKDTHFVNPHGLDAPDHYTSAYDIAVFGNLLLQKPDLAFIVGTRSFQPSWDGPRVDNLNQLLGQYPGAIGVKTGYTLTAGHTIVAAAERNGRRFIVSILGSTDIFADATKLLDWAFASAPSSCHATGTTQVAAR